MNTCFVVQNSRSGLVPGDRGDRAPRCRRHHSGCGFHTHHRMHGCVVSGSLDPQQHRVRRHCPPQGGCAVLPSGLRAVGATCTSRVLVNSHRRIVIAQVLGQCVRICNLKLSIVNLELYHKRLLRAHAYSMLNAWAVTHSLCRSPENRRKLYNFSLVSVRR